MINLFLTDTVKINGAHFNPEIVRILQVACDTAPKELTSIWVTSANDSSHMDGSKHYSNEAFDFRIWGLFGEQAKTWAERMQRALGENYDVVFEGDHIHVEWDPK